MLLSHGSHHEGRGLLPVCSVQGCATRRKGSHNCSMTSPGSEHQGCGPTPVHGIQVAACRGAATPCDRGFGGLLG